MFKFLCKNFPHLGPSVGASQSFKTLVPAPKAIVQETLKSSTSDENKHLFTINYLKNVLGFTPERAVSAVKFTNFKTSEKPDSVISFFKNHGFNTTQIFRLAKTLPQILLCDPEKTLLPKIEFFQSLGFSNTDIIAILTAGPDIFKRSLEKQIVPSFECIKGILQSDSKALDCVKRYCGILKVDLDNTFLVNIKSLKDVGVPESNIQTLLTYQPRLFVLRHSKFRETVEEVKDMGFNPLRLNFVVAVHAFRAMNKSTWEKKVEVYKKWGLSEAELLEAFGKHPWCMTVSEDKIMAKMDILVNKLGFPPSYILRRPKVISLSLQNRIIPRSIIYQALSKKGLVPKNFSLTVFLEAPEKKFLQRFVECFQAEAPVLLALYQKALPSST